VKRKTLPLSGIEHLPSGRSAPNLSHNNSILNLHLDHQSGLFSSNFKTNFFPPISIIAICKLNARYTYLILFHETQRDVCKNLRAECTLAREFRDAGTLLLFSSPLSTRRICFPRSSLQMESFISQPSSSYPPPTDASTDHISPFILSMSAHIQTPANF